MSPYGAEIFGKGQAELASVLESGCSKLAVAKGAGQEQTGSNPEKQSNIKMLNSVAGALNNLAMRKRSHNA